MPKKKVERPRAYERPEPFPIYIAKPLELAERERLRQIFSDPVFRKALQNAHAQKPKTNPGGTGVLGITEFSEKIAANRLHQLQGWEMFEAALFAQAEERVIHKPPVLKENFQES